MSALVGAKLDRLVELSRAIDFKKEQREHKEGIALAALARRVLDLAERASRSDGEGGGAGSAAIASLPEVEEAEAVAAEPAATSEAAAAVAVAAVRAKDRAACSTATVVRNGSRVPRAAAGPKEGGGMLGAAGAEGAAAPEAEAEAVPLSAEEAYVAAVKGLLFGTMRMETSSAGAGGGSRECFFGCSTSIGCYFLYIFYCFSIIPGARYVLSFA